MTYDESLVRAEVIGDVAYRVELDLTLSPEHFESRTTVTFTATPGASSYIDLDAVSVQSMTLNGHDVPQGALVGRRVELSELAERNEFVVESTMAFSHDGQGLHRAIDTADGEAYVYGHLFMDAAPRVYACFDQPDLKAPYDVTVRVPASWSVVANGATREVEPGLWRAETTKPLATYFVTVCAGPWATVRDEYDGVPLGVHARRSLATQLEAQAPEILDITKKSLDYYHELFGIRYPFGEYHQVFVPEFNAGAMENPGCVTFRDQLIFTGAASRTEHLVRANTISHEMAHMWFGDLVTMMWWDDLWLNESFAEYMANRTLVAATEYTDAWVDVAAGRKHWGYAAERSPSTHPVAGAPAPDTDTALQNFDGISYAKGSACLRQLIEHIGDDVFIAGVREYLREYSFKNAALPDFLNALSRAAGEDLSGWAKAWLRTQGLDTLRIDNVSGCYKLIIEPNENFPASRRHTLTVSAYDETGALRATQELRGVRGEVELPLITEAEDVALVIANASDLSWAQTTFTTSDLEVLPHALRGIESPETRAMVWTALAAGLASATVSPMEILTIAEGSLPHETQMPILDVAITRVLGAVVGRYLPWAQREEASQRLARIGEKLLASSDENAQLAGARLVASTGAAQRVRPWFDGQGLPAGLEGDKPFRWLTAIRLAALGELDVPGLDAALEADPSMPGGLSYLTARASMPGAEAKEWAWEELTAAPTPDAPAHSNYEMNALATGFWRAHDEAVVAPYLERYITDIPAMRAWVGEDALARVAILAFPAALASDTLEVETRRMLDADLPASVRRAVVDEWARVREVLESRRQFDMGGN